MQTAYWKIFLEIALLWYFIYMILYFIKGTRTEQLLKGVFILGIIFFGARQLGLDAITWLMTRLFPLSVIALVIIFQPELRRGLARLGQFGVSTEGDETLEMISAATAILSKRKTGALIVIERETGLKTFIETGIPIEGRVTVELITSLFLPAATTHDGAVIIQRDRIAAAGCILPLTQEPLTDKTLGTRHRAAIGVSEESDAVCIVVSEETGAVSVSVAGKLTRDLDEQNLELLLKRLCHGPQRARNLELKVLARLMPRTSDKGM